METADVGLQSAVAFGLARLSAQAVALCGDLVQHVVDAREVVLGAFEPQLRLVAARVEARDAGGFFQDAAAGLRLGGDDLADLALAHEGRRAGAGGGVGEQDLNVAGAAFAAVDAIGRALFALDTACDLDNIGVVELGRGRACRIVEHQADLGHVACGPIAAAGKNHVVHAGRAHALVGVFAHDPTERFDKVRLAAPVGSDDAGQTRLDQKFRRLDEAFEADETELAEMHRAAPVTPHPARKPRRRKGAGLFSCANREGLQLFSSGSRIFASVSGVISPLTLVPLK